MSHRVYNVITRNREAHSRKADGEKMKTMKWTSTTGKEIELRAYCTITMVDDVRDADGNKITVGQKESIDANLELYLDGKLVDSCWNTNFWKTIDYKDGLKKIWGLKLAMTSDRAALVDAWIKEIIEAGKTEEVKAEETDRANADAEARVEKAIAIIAKAEAQSKIMTSAEYATWRTNYNKINNEGGEGYIPSMITQEQYEWAKQTVANSQNS